MGRGRVEAFSDGVVAIIITIMVLELHAPEGPTLAALRPLLPVFASYVLSFVYVGIYWNNHHHMFQAVKTVRGPQLWANLHLLFWLSTVPFATAWMGEHPTESQPVALYGMVLLACAVAYTVLVAALIRNEGAESDLARAMGRDWKGKASLAIYVVGIGVALAGAPWAAQILYALVAGLWLIPDRRIERQLVGA